MSTKSHQSLSMKSYQSLSFPQNQAINLTNPKLPWKAPLPLPKPYINSIPCLVCCCCFLPKRKTPFWTFPSQQISWVRCVVWCNIFTRAEPRDNNFGLSQNRAELYHFHWGTFPLAEQSSYTSLGHHSSVETLPSWSRVVILALGKSFPGVAL